MLATTTLQPCGTPLLQVQPVQRLPPMLMPTVVWDRSAPRNLRNVTGNRSAAIVSFKYRLDTDGNAAAKSKKNTRGVGLAESSSPTPAGGGEPAVNAAARAAASISTTLASASRERINPRWHWSTHPSRSDRSL